MFYANFLFTCGLVLSIYTSQHGAEYTTYGTFMMVVSIIITLIGAVAELKIEYHNNMKKTLKESKFKELEELVEAQSKQIDLLREEIDSLKHR